MKPSLQLRLGQQLTMTPQLQQAIRLLQLPIMELNTQLQEMLEANIMLELEDPPEREVESQEPGAEAIESSPKSEETEELQIDPDESGVLSDEVTDSTLWDDVPDTNRSDPWSRDDRQSELPDTAGQTLRDHLLWQLQMEHFSPREVTIGQAIIDYINDDGYLTETEEGILAMLPAESAFTADEVHTTLTKVQALDPAGVGARTLAECIELQLRPLDPLVSGRDLALTIAREHLDLVAEQQPAMLRRTLGVSDEDLAEALALVRSCHPRPGSAVQATTPEYVVPDVYVRKVDGKWIVEVNHSLAPRLRVNQTYAQMLRGNGEHGALKSQLQEARWLVRSLEIRHETLLKVARCIVQRQKEFLEHGEEQMKPMILRDVAETVQLHESTISRVTSNKYMHTPRGVFELRYFFSSQLSGDDGAEQSSTAIRAKIKKLIGQENPEEPLSDSRIAELLHADGVTVARRTVAKYREALKIAPSSERRRKINR
jgi:RNA polymerase sigma-54 factor